jgi:hypothetical protein
MDQRTNSVWRHACEHARWVSYSGGGRRIFIRKDNAFGGCGGRHILGGTSRVLHDLCDLRRDGVLYVDARKVRHVVAIGMFDARIQRLPRLCVVIPQGMRRVGRKRCRWADVLRRFRTAVLARLWRLRGRSKHDVEIFVAAEDHVLPFCQPRQPDVGDGALERGLLGVLLALLRRHQVLAQYI